MNDSINVNDVLLELTFIKNCFDVLNIKKYLKNMELNDDKEYIDNKMDEMLNSITLRVDDIINNMNNSNINSNNNLVNLATALNNHKDKQGVNDNKITKKIETLKKTLGSKTISRLILVENICNTNKKDILNFKLDVIRHIKNKLEQRIEKKYKFNEFKKEVMDLIDIKFKEYNINEKINNKLDVFKDNKKDELEINKLKDDLLKANNKIQLISDQLIELCNFIELTNKNKEDKSLNKWLNKLKEKHNGKDIDKIKHNNELTEPTLTRIINTNNNNTNNTENIIMNIIK